MKTYTLTKAIYCTEFGISISTDTRLFAETKITAFIDLRFYVTNFTVDGRKFTVDTEALINSIEY